MSWLLAGGRGVPPKWFWRDKRQTLLGEGGAAEGGGNTACGVAPCFRRNLENCAWLKRGYICIWLEKRLAAKKNIIKFNIINILQYINVGHPSRFRRSFITALQVIHHDFAGHPSRFRRSSVTFFLKFTALSRTWRRFQVLHVLFHREKQGDLL